MLRFAVIAILCASFLVAGTVLAEHRGWLHTKPSFLFQIQSLVLIVTLVIYKYLISPSRQGIFIQLYLLSIVVKMIAYGVFLGVVIYQDRPGAFHNVVFFFVCYFIFTALEVAFLYRKIVQK